MLNYDPVAVQVLWGAFQAITEEMGHGMRRASYSTLMREGEDFATALFDSKARLIAQGVYTPGQMGTLTTAAKNIIKATPTDSWRPGDAIITNDPYVGAGHLPDFVVVCPVFEANQLRAFSVTSSHHMDVGGATTGSMSPTATEIYQEGIRIPPTKIYEAGAENRAITNILSANIRFPEKTLNDIKAQIAGNMIGVRRYQETLGKYGADRVESSIDRIIQHSQEKFSEALRTIPKGIYSFEDSLDDYGQGTEPVKIRATVNVREDNMLVDFTGTDEQKKCAMNCNFAFTFAYSIFTIKCVTTPYVPLNEGTISQIGVTAPLGTFVNPRHPAAVGARSVVGYRITDVILGALHRAIPDRICAAPGGAAPWTAFSGTDPNTGRRFFHFELFYGGFGARPNKDGIDAISYGSNIANIPIEVAEYESPFIVTRLEIVPDSGGPGKYRGGDGVAKAFRVMADCNYMVRSDRHKFAPYGLANGKPGQPGTLTLTRNGETKTLHPKGTYSLFAGDEVFISAAGGGGHGDPKERDLDAVIEDVIDGYISRDAAEKEYGADPRILKEKFTEIHPET